MVCVVCVVCGVFGACVWLFVYLFVCLFVFVCFVCVLFVFSCLLGKVFFLNVCVLYTAHLVRRLGFELDYEICVSSVWPQAKAVWCTLICERGST